MKEVSVITYKTIEKQEIRYQANDGTTFMDKDRCAKFEGYLDTRKSMPNYGEWYYVSSFEEYEAVCGVIKETSEESSIFPEFDEELHLGWIKVNTNEYDYDDYGVSRVYSITNLDEYDTLCALLHNIKS